MSTVTLCQYRRPHDTLNSKPFDDIQTLKEEDFVQQTSEELQAVVDPYKDYDDEDSNTTVRVPAPGLFLDEPLTYRLVAGTCTICLTPYAINCDIVWSSNRLCDHVFHVDCAEQWLLRQRDGPLCPCCRRDFIVDPYDVESGESAEDDDESAPEPITMVSDSVSTLGHAYESEPAMEVAGQDHALGNEEAPLELTDNDSGVA
jgi:hypothetical protein